MRKIRAGLIGAGFVGPLHVEAVRRLGYVDVVAVAASTPESAQKKAEALNIAQETCRFARTLARRRLRSAS
jgi:predicted dehydrogenase